MASEKAQNKNARKDIFKIIKNFMRGTPSIEDMQRLSEILTYQAPYENRILLKKSRDDVAISVTGNISDDEQRIVSGRYNDGRVEISYNAVKSLQKFLYVLGHENTHEMQERISEIAERNNFQNVAGQMRDLVESYRYGSRQGDLDQFMEEMYPGLGNIVQKRYGIDQERARRVMKFFAYSSLKYEENARMCGFEYAKEILAALKADKLCDKKTKEFIEQCEEGLASDWKLEVAKQNSDQYRAMRNAYINSVKRTAGYTFEKVGEEIRQNGEIQLGEQYDFDKRGARAKVLNQISDAKLFLLRKQNADVKTYYRALVALRRTEDLKYSDRVSYNYLINANPTELLAEDFKSGNVDIKYVLGNYNFILPEDEKLLSPDEILEYATNWVQVGNFKKLEELFVCLDYENQTEYEYMSYVGYGFMESLDAERLNIIREKVTSSMEIFIPTHKMYERLRMLSKKEMTEMSDEEFDIVSNYERVVNIEKILGDKNPAKLQEIEEIASQFFNHELDIEFEKNRRNGVQIEQEVETSQEKGTENSQAEIQEEQADTEKPSDGQEKGDEATEEQSIAEGTEQNQEEAQENTDETENNSNEDKQEDKADENQEENKPDENVDEEEQEI